MDEPAIEISRDDLLKLGGTSAFAAIAALLGGATPADAARRAKQHIPFHTPVNLDITPLRAQSGETKLPALKRLVVSQTEVSFPSAPPTESYEMLLPQLKLKFDDELCPRQYTLSTFYFYIWK